MSNILQFRTPAVFAICVHYTEFETGELRVHQHPQVFVSRQKALEAAPTAGEQFGLVAWIDEIATPECHTFCYVDGEVLVTSCTVV